MSFKKKIVTVFVILSLNTTYITSADLYVSNETIGNGQSKIYQADPSIYVGPNYMVQSGGTANFTATKSVTLEPGVSLQNGSSVHLNIGTVNIPHSNTISIYEDDGCSSLLTDWAAANNKPRSPKKIFRDTDGIYCVLSPVDSSISSIQINVKSESDPDGISLTLDKRVGTGLANTSALYLSDSSGWNYLKVLGEEVITFTYQNIIASVMVDIGQYAAGGINVFYSDVTEFVSGMSSSGFKKIAEKSFSDDTGTWGDMKTFIKNSEDSSQLYIESDLLMYTCHGYDNGNLYDNNGKVIMYPSDIYNYSDWNNDVEWIFSDACSTLDSSNGRYQWDDALFGSPKPAHMILGYHDPVSADLSNPIYYFTLYLEWDYLVVEAFCQGHWTQDEPYAILAHNDNIGDKLTEVTQDSFNTDMKYYWYDGSDTSSGTYYKSLNIDGTILEIPETESLTQAQKIASIKMKLRAPKIRIKSADMQKVKLKQGTEIFSKPMGVARKSNFLTQDVTKKAKKLIEEIYEGSVSTLSTPQINTAYSLDFVRGESIDKSKGKPIAQLIKQEQMYNGFPVFGDEVSVVIANDDIIQYKNCIHEVMKKESDKNILPEEEIVKKLIKYLKQTIYKTGETIKIVSKRLGYFGYHEVKKTIKEFLPAWEYKTEKKGRIYTIYIDASNGNIFDKNVIREAMQTE
ncbi:DUF6345 domain-containing protein [bacterium]